MRLKILQQQQKGLAAEGRTLTAITADQRTDEQKARLAAITAEGGELDRVAAEIVAEQRLVDAERVLILRDDARIDIGRDRASESPWPNFGAYLQAVYHAQIGGRVDPRLHFEAAATGMGTAVGADGAFAVPTEFAAGIEKEMWDTGQVLSRVNERPLEGNSITFLAIDETSRVDNSRRGGVLGFWVDEGTAPTATQIKLAKIEMKLRKVAALGHITDELMEDAPALSAELQEAFREELLFQVENAVFRGTGAGQPLGFLKAAALVDIAKETGQAAKTILTTNLSKMWARLPARSQASAVWFVNVDCQPQLDELTIPAGTAAVEPRFVNYGPDGILRIKGRPVIAVEYAESIGTSGDITLVDLSRYRVIRKAAGIQTASSMHVRFTQAEQTFRAIYRVDGQPIPRAAITPFKGTDKLSPFISLATRA